MRPRIAECRESPILTRLNTPVRTVYKDDVIAGENLREEQKILEPPNFSVALTFCSMYVAPFINTL